MRRLLSALSVWALLASGLTVMTLNSASAAGAEPDWQLPFQNGQTWKANGPHGLSNGTRPWDTIDFGPGSTGTNKKVVAVAAGTVYKVMCSSTSTKYYLGVDHGGGWKSTYYHLTKLKTELIGKKVAAGTWLGDVGREVPCGGSASADHVHLGILKDGKRIDLDGFSFGNYTVHEGEKRFLGTWTTNSSGSVCKVPTTGYMSCPLKSSNSTVSNKPVGALEEVTSPEIGKVRVKGWAADPDQAMTALKIQAYVGGDKGGSGVVPINLGTAKLARDDVAAANPAYGPDHGFDVTFDVHRYGSQPVYVYAVNATGTAGSDTRFGPVTTKIASPPPLSTAKPTVSGTAQVGKSLTAAAGHWTEGTSFAYQWLRDGHDISGATNSKYTATASDLEKKLSVRVTGSKQGFATSEQLSAATANVIHGTLTSATPKISGTAKVAKKLTAKPGAWSSGTSFTYRWYADGELISEATKSTMTVKTRHLGKRITVTVTGKKAGYTTKSHTSQATAKVGLGTLKAPKPKISGKAKVGKRLTVKTGKWTDGTTLSYRWYANGKFLSGQTGRSLVLTKAHKGKKISVRVAGTRVGYLNKARVSSKTAKVK